MNQPWAVKLSGKNKCEIYTVLGSWLPKLRLWLLTARPRPVTSKRLLCLPFIADPFRFFPEGTQTAVRRRPWLLIQQFSQRPKLEVQILRL